MQSTSNGSENKNNKVNRGNVKIGGLGDRYIGILCTTCETFL